MVAPLAYAFGVAYVLAHPASLRLPAAAVGMLASPASISHDDAAVELGGAVRNAGPRRREIPPSRSAVAKTATPRR